MIVVTNIQTSDQTLNRIQSATADAIKQLQTQNLILGSSIVVATLSTGDTVVTHGLGRVANGFFVIDANASANVWTSATVNLTPNQTSVLVASAAVTVKLYFF